MSVPFASSLEKHCFSNMQCDYNFLISLTVKYNSAKSNTHKQQHIQSLRTQRGGISSVGRAFEWHSKGQGFDSPILHHTMKRLTTNQA